jgi:hypothetical protein
VAAVTSSKSESLSTSRRKSHRNLYEQAIDFGAHRNERVPTTNLKIDDGEKVTELEQVYLREHDEWFMLCLRRRRVRVCWESSSAYTGNEWPKGQDRLEQLRRTL